MKIAGIVPESIVDGPGLRYAIFFQGCPHKCKGCHNPETWDINDGYDMSISEILEAIDNNKALIDGITLSGGDPFMQLDLVKFLQEFRNKFKDSLTVWAYTGYVFEKMLKSANLAKSLSYIDVLVDGPFILSKRNLDLDFRGSSNQRIIDVQQSIQQECAVVLPQYY